MPTADIVAFGSTQKPRGCAEILSTITHTTCSRSTVGFVIYSISICELDMPRVCTPLIQCRLIFYACSHVRMYVHMCTVTISPGAVIPPEEDDSLVLWNGWEKLEHTRCSPYPRRKLAGLHRSLYTQGGHDHVPFRLLDTATLEACVAACESSNCPFVVRAVGAKDGNCHLATRSHSVATHCHTHKAKKSPQGVRTTVYKRTSTPPLRYSLNMYSKFAGNDAGLCVHWDIPKIRQLQAGEMQIVDMCALPTARIHTKYPVYSHVCGTPIFCN